MLPHVRRWFDTHTFRVEDFSVAELARAKAGQLVSVVLPARNEEATVGGIVEEIARTLVHEVGLVDELVVMDSHSTDATARVAAAAGATVFPVGEVLPELGVRDGKGEALWKSLAVTSGDLVVFLDADLRNFSGPGPTGPRARRGRSAWRVRRRSRRRTAGAAGRRVARRTHRRAAG
jgi:glucosyl-3-phosphoglycerate synthase